MANVKKGFVKWLLDAVNDGSRRAPGDVSVKKPTNKKPDKKPPPKNQQKPPPKNQQKPPPKNQQKPPPKSKPKVRQRNDGRWAVAGNPNKTYANKGAATKAANKATAAAEAAKRAEKAADLKKNIGKGIGIVTVGGLGAGVIASNSNRNDKNKGEGPTIKKATQLKSATKGTGIPMSMPKGSKPVKSDTKGTGIPMSIPKGSKPVKKDTKGTGIPMSMPEGAKPAAKKSAPKKLKSFKQGVRSVDTPFGKIKMDSTDKGMAFEEFDSKYGGQIKDTVKRRMGGIVKKGYGKAQRGY